MRFTVTAYCTALFLSIATFVLGSELMPDTGKPIEPFLSWTGSQSQVRETKYLRIDHKKQWQKVWLKHLGKSKNQAFQDSDTQFQIDFDRCEVIAIFQGAGWNSRGIRLEEVKETAEKITIRYDNISYQTSGIDGGGVRVSTFTFLVFPKTSKPYQLEENTQGLKSRPAKWTERAVLKSE